MNAPLPAEASSDLLLRADAEGVTTLTLNRPRQYNALSEGLLAALQSALDAIASDASVRVVVIDAAGPAFCAEMILKRCRPIHGPNGFRRCSHAAAG